MTKNLINFDDFYNKPCHIYIKNFNGIILNCNELQAKRTGFSSTSALIGLRDTDVALNSYEGRRWQEHDQAVAHFEQPQIFLESGGWEPENASVTLLQKGLSYKAPYYTHTGKRVGIIGLSFFPQDLHEIASWDDQPLLKGLLLMTANHFNLLNPTPDTSLLSQLSIQQKAIFNYTVQGKTVKEIASIMDLSLRTVEYYIELIKNKLGCERKKDFFHFASKR